MKRFACSGIALGCLGMISGCASVATEASFVSYSIAEVMTEDRSMTESSTERLHRLMSVTDLDTRAILDDIDMVLQRDRPTRLTRWHER